MITVRERMTSPVKTLPQTATCDTALNLMREGGMHHLPVLDKDGTLVGMVAERDLLLGISRHLQAYSMIEISDVMHRNVITTTPDTPISAAAKQMLDAKIGGLPVVDAKDGLVGVITESDIFKVFVEICDK